MTDYYFEKLSAKHSQSGLTFGFKVNPDSCENPEHYESFLKYDALFDKEHGLGTTHLLIEENTDTHSKAIMGFVTLRASCLTMECENYTEGHAALEISELAVDKNYERMGVGTTLVKLAFVEADELNNQHLGIEYLVLCADPASTDFYLHSKFNLAKLDDFYYLPREQWNVSCTPLFSKLHSI